MSTKGEIVSVNISKAKGTIKEPVAEIVIDEDGILCDAHAGAWHRQVSLLDQESIDTFAQQMGREIGPGEFAENLTTSGIRLADVAVLDRFRIGDVELEITQIGKECHGEGCAIFREVGKCVMPKEGIFTRVVRGGKVKANDAIEWLPRDLVLRVITLSDRAFAGEYADKSGPKVKELLEAFFSDKRWHAKIETIILPDDAAQLRDELTGSRDGGADVVITTGGTGVGPRDITPEVVSEVCDRIIPGIMENIRVKFGSKKPNALLSRSVAGIAGMTQVYALPGSVRAVEEYMAEILKTMEHIIYMLHGLDIH